MITLKQIKRRISVSWRFFAAILIPLILLPMCFVEEDSITEGDTTRPQTKCRTAYVIIIMASYWTLELIPLPVTSLLPLVMFPLLGVVTSYRVSENYTKESNMIFLGGVIVALGMEYCNLHRRIAIRIMMAVGTSPIRLLFGVMASTAFLSMWISSTTCVALLVPLAVAIIDEIYDSPELNNVDNPAIEVDHYAVDSRRHSTFSAASHHGRRTPMFENSALEGIRRRVSDSHSHDHIRSPRSSIYPQLNRHQSDQHLNMPNDERPKPRQFAIVLGELASEPHLNNLTAPRTVGFVESNRQPISVASSYMDLNEERDEYIPSEEELLEEKRRANIKKMYLFAMAYAANIGGTAVITGTAPNKIFKEVIKLVDVSTQGDDFMRMTFFVWMAVNLPPVIVNLFITWIFLIIKYQGMPNFRTWYGVSVFFKSSEINRLQREKMDRWKSGVRSYLQKEYDSLGKITWHEIAVGLIFILVVVLWVTRDPEMFHGWSDFLDVPKTGDSTAAMLGVVLLFVCPRDWKFLFGSDKDAKYEPLLDWKFVSSKLPWGVLLLLGSGFAISDASNYSGLSTWIGKELILLRELSRPGLLLVVIVMTSLITEVTSNVACANILLPIMLSVSKSMEIHPYYLTVPCAITCAYAFILPVSAPSNAIVFAAGNFSTLEMFKNGFFLNVVCVAVLYINTLTLGNYMFDFENYDYTTDD